MTIENTGEMLKYGETIHPDTRYSQAELDRYNADMEIIISGTKQEIHQWQHEMNESYRMENGDYPSLTKNGW